MEDGPQLSIVRGVLGTHSIQRSLAVRTGAY